MNSIKFWFFLTTWLQLQLVGNIIGQFNVTNSTLNSGGGTSTNSEYQIHHSAGVQYISTIQNSEHKIEQGFWVIGGTLLSIKKDDTVIPTKFELYQNYPNPFNPTTVIKFGLPETSNVRIEIYNMLGQRVDIVTNENKASGYYEVTWNASNLSSGIFLINFTAVGSETGHSYNHVMKALLLK